MEARELSVQCDGQRFDGLLMSDGEGDRRPLVLIFPTFVGRSPMDLDVGGRLSEAGYRALACDFYGGGRSGSTREECSALMQPLMEDRSALRRRLLAWLEAGADLAAAEPARTAAIGFCFGGLCALDLARSGAGLAGVASFHGLLKPTGLGDCPPIRAKVIAFHGWDDPMAPPQDVVALGAELTRAGADWQIHAYGGTVHGFTNPKAASPELGILYNEDAARRAWTALSNFLGEIFG